MKLSENQRNSYTVFRAYNKYWIVPTILINRLSVNLSDLRVVCSVDKISINNVLKIAKNKVKSENVKYEAFIVVLMG